MRLLALALAGFAATAAFAAPTEIAAEYSIAAGGVPIGRVSETFSRQGDAYRLESTTKAEGVFRLFRDDTIVLTSVGRVGPKGLQPRHFERRRLGDAGRDVVADFDWEKSRLRSRHGGEESVFDLPPGTQDRLSVLYQFMHEAPGSRVVGVHMTNGRSVRHYEYRKLDEPRIVTPAGEFATLRYERVTADEKENRAQLWLARDRYHLPVRIEFEDSRGLRLEQTLVSLKAR